MTTEELAGRLTGRSIGNEITEHEEREAKNHGLLVIFGASDDLCELRGAINDELGSYVEATVLISEAGTLLPEIEDDDQKILAKYGALGYVRESHRKAKRITSRWHDEGNPCWSYETTLPHSTFDIMEDGEVFCRGVVVDLKD
jgi:hypothetical protein